MAILFRSHYIHNDHRTSTNNTPYMLTLYALEVRQKKYQFVLFSSISITNSFRLNPHCSLLYAPVKVSFVLRVTTSRYIFRVKFREKKLGTGVHISNPCPLSCLTLPHTLWHQTHTQKEHPLRQAIRWQ